MRDTSVVYVGFAGRFLGWLSIAMLCSILFSSDVVPALQRSALAAVLFLMGTLIVIVGPSPGVLLQMLRTNPTAVLSGYRIGIFSVVPLISVPFLLAVGRHDKKEAFLQFNLLQLIGGTLLTCVLLSIVHTHGAFAFHYFSALTLLGFVGARLADLKRDGLAWGIASIGVATIAIAAFFALSHYGFTDWMGPSPRLAMFTMGGILPLVASVAFAVVFTLISAIWKPSKLHNTEPDDAREWPIASESDG